MGVAATYVVAATGSSLSYQWSKNGSAISGTTAASYTTPATAFADTGSSYTVIVGNSVGAVTSAAATLTVTARAPAAGDLRFQQVDSPATVNGYDSGPVGVGSTVGGPVGAWGFSYSIGTPLYIYPIACGPPAPVTEGWTCSWLFQQFYLPGQLDGLGLYTGYGADYFTNFPADLQTTAMGQLGESAPAAPNSVITSLDLEPANDIFAFSFIQSSQGGSFDLSQQTVAPADFQAAATQEGAHSRVITAVSYNAGQVVYFSYGWKQDTSTVYDVRVAAATAETMATVASSLAAQGYILTAIGGTDSTDSYLIVGTRVQGDTVPRPFAVVPQGLQNPYDATGVCDRRNCRAAKWWHLHIPCRTVNDEASRLPKYGFNPTEGRTRLDSGRPVAQKHDSRAQLDF
jgi:hypothetical protein